MASLQSLSLLHFLLDVLRGRFGCDDKNRLLVSNVGAVAGREDDICGSWLLDGKLNLAFASATDGTDHHDAQDEEHPEENTKPATQHERDGPSLPRSKVVDGMVESVDEGFRLAMMHMGLLHADARHLDVNANHVI